MPQISIKYLSELQHKESWIENIFLILGKQRTHQQFFVFENILFKKQRLDNTLLIDQIVLPDQLATAIITRFHTSNYFSHMGVVKMKRHLGSVFHIRNFVAVANEVLKKCSFCQLNKVYPNRKLETGMKIHINAPRQFLYTDICVVQSTQKVDAFLTLVDGFSKYAIFVPVASNATAHEICELIFSHWISHFSFPMTISCDGGSNFTNKTMGQVASLLNCKLCRIAPYNSQANLAERYNRLALAALRIFHQSYGLNPDNFSLLLSLTGQMLNAQIMSNGYCPFYIQMGAEPRLNDYISLQSSKSMTNASDYAKNLVKVQNVCYIINQQNLVKENTNNNEIQQKDVYKVGSFVLLKKKAVGPRMLHKLKPIYHRTPYRILRRTRTNAVIFPYGIQFSQKRFKQEGEIPKNMCTLARLSNLKPISNGNKLLGLSLSQKLMLELRQILSQDLPEISQVEVIPNIALKRAPEAVIQNFNPSICVLDRLSDHHPRDKLLVQQPKDNIIEDIQDIRNVKLQTFCSDILPLSDFSSSGDAISPPCSYQVRLKKPVPLVPTLGSFSSSHSGPSFNIRDSYFTQDDFESNHSSLLSTSSDDLSNISPNQGVPSVRPSLPSNRISRRVTSVPLPSGHTISIITYPSPIEMILDKKGSTVSTPLTVKTARPRSLFSDLTTRKK